MKYVLSVLLIIAMLFSCASCDRTSQTNDAVAKHYEIDLNVDNFETYLTHSSENHWQTISGVLTFAYYENVVVTFHVEYKLSNRTYQGEYTVKLNAAGYAEFHESNSDLLAAMSCPSFSSSTSRSFSIISVTGKVIFTA